MIDALAIVAAAPAPWWADGALLAWIAIVVAVAAAGFTGWQAWTMHLQRTQPPPASLVLPPAYPAEPRRIMNEGGSAAHSIQVFVWGVPSTRRSRRDAVRQLARERTPELLGAPITGGKVAGSLPAQTSAAIIGFGPQAAMFGPPDERPGTSGLDLLYSPALAYWTDSRGRRRHAWIELR
jgi:hypothetical protein